MPHAQLRKGAWLRRSFYALSRTQLVRVHASLATRSMGELETGSRLNTAKDPVGATVRLRKRAFACGLLRRDRSRLTFGVRDGAAAAGKPNDAGGKDHGEEHYGCCEPESDTRDEIAVGNRKNRLLRGRVEMFDRSARPDLGRVSAGIRIPDDHIGDFLALGRIRKRVGEVCAEASR